jgi:hypothetical protein
VSFSALLSVLKFVLFQEERGLGGGLSLPGLPKEVGFALVVLAVIVALAKFAEQKSG